MSHDVRDTKDGPLFSAAEYRDGARRSNASVLQLWLLVLDLDHILHTTADEVVSRLASLGLEMWVYSTYSYDEHEASGACLRVVLPLSRPVSPKEWNAFWKQAWYVLAPESDAACKDPARMYYTPSAKPGAATVNVHVEGNPVDVDAMLREGKATLHTHIEVGDTYTPQQRLATPPIDQQMRDWAHARVSASATRVCNTPPGPIYPVLNTAAFEAGRFVPHVLSLETVRGLLHEAHAKRNPERIEKNDAILERGLADGRAVPWRPARPYELTDEGLSTRMLEEHSEHLRYVREWGKWLGYDGKRWLLAGDAAPAFRTIRDLSASLRDEADYVGGKRAASLKSAARYAASHRGARSIIAMASPLDRFRIELSALDTEPRLLGCENGVVDLSNGSLHEHHAAHYITHTTGHVYLPDAQCPTWARFVLEVCGGDHALVSYMQRAVGYTLTAYTTEQCLFFLHGDGRNGKSTFLVMLQKLLGEYATTCSADLILVKKHEQHPTSVAALHGKRCAVVAEVDDGRSWDEAMVKNLTGSDLITARRMREDYWVFTPRHKLWIAGNYRPSVRGVDNGIWRRMRMIPFDVSFAGREDLHLHAKLVAELPGIFAWAVRGAVEWHTHGLKMPARVEDETRAYRDEQNFFGQFVNESLDLQCPAEERITRAQLVQLYASWALRNGAPALGARAIAERIRRYGAGEAVSQGVQHWTCVRVKRRSFETRAAVA